MIRPDYPVEKLEQQLMVQILRGAYASTGRLPTRAQISRDYGVGINTVTVALGRLTARGFCQTRSGAATQVTFPPPDAHPRIRAELQGQIDQTRKRLEELMGALSSLDARTPA